MSRRLFGLAGARFNPLIGAASRVLIVCTEADGQCLCLAAQLAIVWWQRQTLGI